MSTILTIVGLVLLIVMLLIGFGLKEKAEDEGDEKARFPFSCAVLAIIGAIIFVYGSSVVIIPTGHTGVRITFGQVDEMAVQNGFNWKIPFVQKIEKVNNKQQDVYFEGQIWGETAERAALYYDKITVTYHIAPEKSAWIYAHVSNYKENLITQSIVGSSIKSSSKTLISTDATNRGIIEPLAAENIQGALDEKYGVGVVNINKVVIADADFEEGYNQAIAQKQTAQLAYEQQQIENKKKIEAAEADAKVKITQAQGEADAAVIKAQGEADANKLIDGSLTDRVLQQMYLTKWDGALPKVSLADSNNALVDVGNVVQDIGNTKN